MTADAAVAMPLMGKKMKQQLGGRANEAAAAAVSDFAKRQMAKMGWTDGKGLGKNEQGIKSHVRVKQREQNAGVGVEKVAVEEQSSQWWYGAYDKLAGKIQIDASDEEGETKKKKDKKSKKKRKREAESSSTKFSIPTDEELFAATGGKLYGRRAYGSCTGKLKRDEMHVAGVLIKEKTTKVEGDKKEKKKKAKKSKSA